MAKYHPLFHKLKSVVGYSIAIIVIIIALAISGLRFLLTTANVYQAEIEQLASSLLKQPVKIGRMDAKLSGLVPTLIFHDVQLISSRNKKSLFSLSRIDVGLSFYTLLWQQKIIPAQLTIRGMNLYITRTVEGKIKVKGVDLDSINKEGDKEFNQFLEQWLSQQGQVALEDSTFTWKDEQNAGLTWFFNDVSLLLKKSHERHQLVLSSKLPTVLGEKIKLSFDLVGNIVSPESWDVNAFIETKGLKLAPIQKYINSEEIGLTDGVADLKLWIDWKNKNIKQLSGDVRLHDLSYHLNKKGNVNLKVVSGAFDIHLDENNLWSVGVENFNYNNVSNILNESKFSLAFSYDNKNIDKLYIQSNYVDLGVLSKIVTDNHLVSRKNEERINHIKLQGDIRDVHIAWDNNELDKLKADFIGVGMRSWKNLPKLEAISGNVKYANKKGIISLRSKNSVVGFPQIFRNDFKLDELISDIIISDTKQGILFDVERLTTNNTEVSAVSSAKLWMPKDGASPYLDLQTYVSDGDISKVSHYLPVSIMSTPLVNWLDKGLLGGKVGKSTIIYNGNFRDFPFKNKEGVFNVALETSGLIMNYKEGWPKISNANMEGVFTGMGMNLHLLTGEVEKNMMYDSHAEIPSFSEVKLQLDLAMTGSTGSTIKYLVNSPILSNAKSTVSSMRFMGDVDTRIKINIPLSSKKSEKELLSYSGVAKLRNSSVFMLDNRIDITEGAGDVFFTDKKFSSKKLVGKILGEKATLSVISSSKNKSISIAAKGNIKPGIILKRFNIPGAKKISGNALFYADITFPDSSRKNNYPKLTLNSDLYGVSSDLPELLYKNKRARHKVNFTTLFTGNNKVQIGVDFNKNGSAILELDQSKDTTSLIKGAISVSNEKSILPRKNILYIDGSVNEITPSKWVDALELNKEGNNQTFFINPIVFNLDKLKIITDDKNEEDNAASLNPKKLPAFEGIIKSFYLDKDLLGRADFKVSQKEYGLHLDELILSEKNMKLFANGTWRYINGKSKTDMNITLNSDDFGGMLTNLGYSAVIEQGVANAVGKINWKGGPTQFSLDKLNGKIQLEIKKGNIKEVDAGAGRLLGLFSLSALPRKLFGDFKDTFKEGFNFDNAIGEIVIAKGDAYLNNFEISSPVANITVSGRTGLVAKDYDNIVEVIPEVGGGLAGAAALLVNLPAGIGVWLLDKLTGQQFNSASARSYEISGSWEKPVIELIEEE